jgi:hypothetical protein
VKLYSETETLRAYTIDDAEFELVKVGWQFPIGSRWWRWTSRSRGSLLAWAERNTDGAMNPAEPTMAALEGTQ